MRVTNSSISLFRILSGNKQGIKEYAFFIINVKYSDSIITHSEPLISTEGIIAHDNSSLFIQFSSLSFVNIQHNNGELMRIAHQTGEPAFFINVKIENVSNAFISVESKFTQYTQAKTNAQFQNLTINSVNVSSEPLFRAKMNAELEFLNLTCTSFESYYSDAGLIRAESDSIVNIMSSDFQNNSGVYSTLFKVQDFATININQSSITNTFALTNAVFFEESNGLINFAESQIDHNYALKISLGEVYSFGKGLVITS